MSPVLDSSGSVVKKRRNPEEMEKDLRGDVTTELSLPLKEGRGGDGQSFSCFWTPSDSANCVRLKVFSS